MKKLLLGSVAVAALIAGPAMAADLGVRPVYKTPVVISSWTGLYVGLDTGGSIGVSSTTDTAVVTGAFPGFVVASTPFSNSSRRAPTGWIFGGQVGYNYQVANWVLGVEADWQWTNQKDTARLGCSSSADNALALFLGAPLFGQCFTDEQKLTDFGTARARGGILVNDSLWYVTGGLAWGTVKDSYSYASNYGGSLGPAPFFPAFPGGAAAFSSTKTGWTLGGGVETRIGGGWSLKLEYLYVDLGTVTNAFGLAVNPALVAALPGLAAATTIRSSTSFTDNIVRVGVNYKIF
jgi:outer membrane immunogenic protein